MNSGNLHGFGTSYTSIISPKLREMETHMVQACHGLRQPLQNHPSGRLGGQATPWLAEKVLDGQPQRVDIPAHARIAHSGIAHGLEEDLC